MAKAKSKSKVSAKPSTKSSAKVAAKGSSKAAPKAASKKGAKAAKPAAKPAKKTAAKPAAKSAPKAAAKKTSSKVAPKTVAKTSAKTVKPAEKVAAKVAAKTSAPKAAAKPAAKTPNPKTLEGIEKAFSPLDDRVVVQREEALNMTAGGIYIPDSATENDKPNRGRVLAVGLGGRDKKGRLRPLDVQLGDLVIFDRYAGSDININGENLTVLREKDIVAVVN